MTTTRFWFSNRSAFSAVVLALMLSLGVGCSDGNNGDVAIVLPGCADTGSCASNPPLAIGGERQAQVFIPANYTPTTRYPLVIVLHGFGANGAIQAAYLGLSERVDNKQFVLVAPDGTPNDQGTLYWDATPACCAFDKLGEVDDVAYIRGLIEEAARTYSIDPSRVALFGHSNGGFMTLRMACEASEYVTAAISLAGSTFEDAASCAPAARPVSVLLVHGDDDTTIRYEGGANGGNPYPGAVETSERYALQAGCDVANPVPGPDLDVDASVAGPETTTLIYPDCLQNAEVELWTIVGGPHIPAPWNPAAQDAFVDWLIGHPRS